MTSEEITARIGELLQEETDLVLEIEVIEMEIEAFEQEDEVEEGVLLEHYRKLAAAISELELVREHLQHWYDRLAELAAQEEG